jgi:signal transduction histidine kinase
MSFSKKFAQQPHTRIVVEMTLVMLAIGLIDFLLPYQISFGLFYGAPILVVAWYCDRKSSVFVALLAGITWWWSDWQSGHPYLHNFFEAWEVTMRLGYFLLMAFGGSALRAKSDIAATRIALLEHSQRLEKEIVNISESERRRIGQDLHDGLCQYLAALGCAATSLRDDLEKLQLPHEAEVADELAQLLRDAVVQTRDLARGLVPVHLGEEGLVLALEGLAHSVTRLQGINCTFESKGVPMNYEESAAMHFYRIAQEAINNATKHGKAQNIAISLDVTQLLTTLRIADDGAGISRTMTSCDGMGLNIMGYRARLTGGELKIEEAARGGTVVSCIAPSKTLEDHEHAVA